MAAGRPARTPRSGSGRGFLTVVLAAVTAACGGPPGEGEAKVVRETPEEAILRIGTSWESHFQDRGFRAAPAPIATFAVEVTSTIAFTRGGAKARERVATEETFKMADGTTFHCKARGEAEVAVRWGRTGPDPAVQVQRPGLRLARACDGQGFPEPVLELPPFAVRFALRGDRLVPFEPKTEQREYIPTLQ